MKIWRAHNLLMNLNWRWLCRVLNSELAFTERLLLSLFFLHFSLSTPQLWAAELELSPGFVKRGAGSLAPRRVWVLSLSDFVSGYVCCLLARAHTGFHTEFWHPFICSHKHQRPVFWHTCMDSQAHCFTRLTHNYTHVTIRAAQLSKFWLPTIVKTR